jgi:hypothetical protein
MGRAQLLETRVQEARRKGQAGARVEVGVVLRGFECGDNRLVIWRAARPPRPLDYLEGKIHRVDPKFAS